MKSMLPDCGNLERTSVLALNGGDLQTMAQRIADQR
jgi:hypothetical protein